MHTKQPYPHQFTEYSVDREITHRHTQNTTSERLRDRARVSGRESILLLSPKKLSSKGVKKARGLTMSFLLHRIRVYHEGGMSHVRGCAFDIVISTVAIQRSMN